MATSEVLTLIKVFKDPLVKFFKETTEDVDFFLDKGIKPYIESHLRKIRVTNTFLHRTEKVDFYKTFFPLKIKSQRTTVESDENFINNLFKAGNCVTIIGQAGSGKTMLTKHIFLSAVKTKIKIPLLIELRFLNDYNGHVIDFIKRTIGNNDLAPNERILERILNEGNFLFILDGFDEIFSENKQRIVHDLDMFIDKHPNNLYLLTSRPGVNVENLPRFRNFIVSPLEDSQIVEFITKQLHGEGSQVLIKRIINTIKRPENKDYQFFLQNPLLLSMFMLTFNSYPELPRLKSKFYWNVFDTLCTKHDSITKKGGYQHERRSGLQNEEIERILMWLSYISLFDRKLIFDSQYFSQKLTEIGEKLQIKFNLNHLIYDLTVSTAIVVIEGLEYRFPHRSMQEYFTALLIKNQTPFNKSRIYFEKFTQLEFVTHFGNENLWSLCLEMDKEAFSKNFLIRHLDEFISGVDSANAEEIPMRFFKYLNLGYSFRKDKGKWQVNSIRTRASSLQNILEFLEISRGYMTISIFSFRGDKLHSLFQSLVDKGFAQLRKKQNGSLDMEIYEFSFQQIDEEMLQVIRGLGICDEIVRFVKLVKTRTQKLKDELSDDETNNLSLLQF